MSAAPMVIVSRAAVSTRVQAARPPGADRSMMPLLLLDVTTMACRCGRTRVGMLSNWRARAGQSCGRDSIEICSLPAISSWQESVFMSAGSRYQTRWRQ